MLRCRHSQLPWHQYCWTN